MVNRLNMGYSEWKTMMPGRVIPTLAALACIAVVLLAGCAGPGERVSPTPEPTTPAPAPSVPPAVPISFDQTNDGGTYPVSLDAEIRLRLPENPTTGYLWTLSVSPGLSITNETYVPDDPTGRLVGSGGTRIWSLKAVLPGARTISGSYRRPWESGPDPGARGFNLTLDVEEGSCGTATCPVTGVPARFHVYTDEDNGRTVQEGRGEVLNIRLRENPTTGYSWNLSMTDGLTMTGDEYIPTQEGGQMVGVGGVRSFHLTATGAGMQMVTGEYRRPWVLAGTVTYMDLEGGFFGITGDDGKKYDPLNLEVKYRKDGLRVAFVPEPVKDAAGIHMWGTMVNLVEIEEIQAFTLTVEVR
jgi:inhibitor of cysteine peptidase